MTRRGDTLLLVHLDLYPVGRYVNALQLDSFYNGSNKNLILSSENILRKNCLRLLNPVR